MEEKEEDREEEEARGGGRWTTNNKGPKGKLILVLTALRAIGALSQLVIVQSSISSTKRYCSSTGMVI